MPAQVETPKFDPVRFLAELAFDQGFNGRTFATHDEYSHPVYNPAWALGAEYREGRVFEPHMLLGCGCAKCRMDRIVAKAKQGE